MYRSAIAQIRLLTVIQAASPFQTYLLILPTIEFNKNFINSFLQPQAIVSASTYAQSLARVYPEYLPQ